MAHTSPFEEGRLAALRSDTKRCPYDANTLKALRWWSGYHYGSGQYGPVKTMTAPEPVQVDDHLQLSLFGGVV